LLGLVLPLEILGSFAQIVLFFAHFKLQFVVFRTQNAHNLHHSKK